MSHSTLRHSTTAIIRRDEQPTDRVREAYNHVVSETTKETYRQENIKFIFYLYDMDPDEYIWDEVLDAFHKAHDKDQENERTKQNRTNLRECIRSSLMSMNRWDNNCPIVLQKVSFSCFTKYMVDIRSTTAEDDTKYLSASSYGLMKSALVWLFNTCGQEMERGLCNELNTFMRAMKKKIAKAKAASGVSLEEGKKPMSFAVYQLLCQKLFQSKTPDALFAHTFLVLEWNLMARSNNIEEMNVAHIEWRQDCLLFFFAKSKRNQTGEDSERPFHVYSNPENPEICPVLALATYLVAYPDVLRSGSLLFPGSRQYNRFMKIFHATIDEHEDEFQKLGIKSHDLGSHSSRKGAITLVTTGCTVSPPMAATCIRAGWSMGPVKDRYIHYEKAGDQFVGRTVTGIPALGSNFAISPVHWDWSGLVSPICERNSKKQLEEMISMSVGDKETLGAAAFGMMQYLFASLVFHSDYLNKTLDERSKLRASPGFMAAADCELKKFAVVRFPWELTAYTPKPTGIPPHVMLLNKLEGMEKEFSKYPQMILDGVHQEIQELREGIKEELNNRNIGGPEFSVKELMKEMKDMISDLREDMLEQKGARDDQVTGDDDNNDLLSVGFGDFGGEDDRDSTEANPTGSPKRKSAPTVMPTNPSKRRKVAVLDWQTCLGSGKNKFVLTPPGYQFPFLTLSTLISTWYCGDQPKNVPPYRMLNSKDVPAVKNARAELCMMRKLMVHVERAAVEVANRKELVIRRRPWTAQDCKALYEGVAHFFQIPGDRQERRFAQLSWKSYYNILYKRKWQLLGEKVEDGVESPLPARATNDGGSRRSARKKKTSTTTNKTGRKPPPQAKGQSSGVSRHIEGRCCARSHCIQPQRTSESPPDTLYCRPCNKRVHQECCTKGTDHESGVQEVICVICLQCFNDNRNADAILEEQQANNENMRQSQQSQLKDPPQPCRASKPMKRMETERTMTSTAKAMKKTPSVQMSQNDKVRKQSDQNLSELTRCLSDEEEAIVHEALYGEGPPNETVASTGNDKVLRQSIQTLRPTEWLNDEVVNQYFLLLGQRQKRKCHFFRSHFFTKLLQIGHKDPAKDGKYNYDAVRKWTKRKDIFKKDKLLFVINLGQLHWIVAMIDMKNTKIQVYDSNGQSRHRKYLDALLCYLRDEHMAKKEGKPLPGDWELVGTTVDTPRQKNGYDCGVFTCMFADFLSRGHPLVFSQQHINHCRKRIALAILTGRAILP